MTFRWYGEEPAFRAQLEGPARVRYGRHLSVSLLPDLPGEALGPVAFGALVYSIDNISVRGRDLPVPVEVWFRADVPFARLAGIPAHDFPSVFGDRFADSPHRHGDKSLCLYFPFDPPELRWKVSDGLLPLLDMASEHLFFEDYYRRNKRKWLGREAPHGFDGVTGTQNAFSRGAR